ncbi:DUF4349 domain-containing protein, partial [Streptomyces sp. AK04-3B]|nr:DUF4349 domain-containing protein [Streptomyces sp. AK04-3B]
MIANPLRRPLPRPGAVLLAASLLLTGCGGTASSDGAGADAPGEQQGRGEQYGTGAGQGPPE